jgi:predicted permease
VRQWHRFRLLLRALFRRQAVERELDDELREWVETLAERHAAAGLDREAARRAALRDMGSLDAVKQVVRDSRVTAGLDALLIDGRYGWRSLRKAPALSAVIVATLALGIGANTAIFSVVRAMLLSPLPYAHADRLLFIWADRTAFGYPRAPLSGPEFKALREGTSTDLEFGAVWQSGSVTLAGEGEPEQIRAALVTNNFFRVLGARAALGRTFLPEDAVDGAPPTILIGWDLFVRRYGGDPAIVGRPILVGERPTTVIGVLPAGFRLLLPPDASVPDRIQAWSVLWPEFEQTANRFLRVIARMPPGASVEQARHEISQIAGRLSDGPGRARALVTVRLHADGVREIRGPLLALSAGVAILLTIACVNVAALLVARAAARRRETALRLALGSSTGRLLRQSLAEGLLLTTLGAAAGIMVGWAGLQVLVALAPEPVMRMGAPRIDRAVLGFTAGIALIWGTLLSLAPMTELVGAGSATAPSVLQSQWRATTRAGYRTRSTLVVLQIMFSVVLLVAAGLLVRAFVHVVRSDPGFRSDHRLTFRLAIPGHRAGDPAVFNTFAAEIEQRLAALPGVVSVGAISHVPYDDLPNWGGAYALTNPVPPGAPNADFRAVSPGLFETLGVRLIEGRFFTGADDDPRDPVAIVDDRLARQLWPGRSALNQRLFVRIDGVRRFTVVGTVGHLRLRSPVEDLGPQIFFPWRLAQRNPIAFVVRTASDPASHATLVRAAVATVDPRLPIYDVLPLDTYVSNARATRQFTMRLAVAFAVSALGLTCIGVYGVLMYGVARRRHEFGVRRALGADAARVRREVIGEGMRLVAGGCGLGLAAALPAGQLIQSQLYAVHPGEPSVYLGAIAVIVCAAALACWIPARRATSVSPMDALRTE